MPNDYTELQEILKANPKTWLITGVAGFIGSNLLEKLLLLNQTVIGIDNFSTGFFKNLKDVQAVVGDKAWSRFHLFEGDIRQLEDCRAVVSGVDYILHQAALASVPLSIEDPIATNQVNINGFLNMLVAARDADVKRFVYASSSAIYGDDPNLPKVEEMHGQPLSPYGVTKYVNEFYGNIFTRLYGLECIGLRYFNVFGARQDPNGAYAAVIPQWFSNVLQRKEIYINGDGGTSRDFCYVDDVVGANLLAACVENQAAIAQVYNIAFGSSTTLNQLFELIRETVAEVLPTVANLKPIYRDFRPGDIYHSVADISKARTFLGYKPTYSVREGLHQAAIWYLKNLG
jgi:UDP-N-acetylglucosamine 4-epimerase